MGKAEILRACKYAFVPNRLGYCGARDFSELFESFIKNPSDARIAEVKDALRSFRAMHAYLKLIARCNSLEPFDDDVLEAYWLGNVLLENVPKEAVQELINSFESIPEQIRKKKAEHIQKHAYIQHSFHVLYVNFLSQKLRPVLQNLDRCIVKWGEIIEAKEKRLKVKSIGLIWENGELKLREKIFTIEKGFVSNAETGTLVSIHWENAIEQISKEQKKNLKRYLLENIALANSYLRSEPP